MFLARDPAVNKADKNPCPMEVFTLKSKYIIIAFNNQKKKTINYFLIIETSNNQEIN